MNISDGINATQFALQTHMSMTYCRLHRLEKVEPWPYAHNSCQRAAKTTQLSLHMNLHLHMTFVNSIGTKTSKRDHMPTINSKTKLANCVAVASAVYTCFNCCCAGHTQSSWLIVALEVRKQSQIHTKNDVLTQDSRLADCRGAEFTVKVAVGPTTEDMLQKRTQDSTRNACSSIVSWQVGVKLQGGGLRKVCGQDCASLSSHASRAQQYVEAAWRLHVWF